MQDLSIQNKIAVCSFDANAITGTVSAEDGLGDVFTSRGVRYLNPKKLNGFAAIRQATHNALLRIGTRFLNGYAVAEERANEAEAILAEQQAKWETAKAELLASYEEAVREWIAAHPEVEGFRGLFPTAQWVEKRIGFEWTMFYIEATGKGGREGMRKMLGRLPAQVIEEIAQDVATSWTPGAQKMNAKTRGVLVRVARKLESLSFLGGELGAMAEKLRQVIDMLPQEGQFAPAEAAMASMVLAMLSSEKTATDLLTMDPKALQAPAAPKAEAVFSFAEPDPEPAPAVQSLPAVPNVQDAQAEPEQEDEFELVFA